MDSVEKIIAEMRHLPLGVGGKLADRLEALTKEPITRLREDGDGGYEADFHGFPVFAAPPSSALEAQAAAMREALEWFVQNDDTNNTPENKFWMDGLDRAKQALSTDAGREDAERLRKAEEERVRSDEVAEEHIAITLKFTGAQRGLICALDEAEAELEQCKKTIGTARELLDESFDMNDRPLYDDQGVNQAHRVLAGGFAPRETKTEGGI